MVDVNLNVKAVEKLLDYTASGVGAIAGPMLATWKASQEGKAKLISARADAEVRRIEAESEAGTVQIIAKAKSEARQYTITPNAEVHGTVGITRDDVMQRIEFQEWKRLSNISGVVRDAADELGDKEVPDHEPDPDWTARFFDGVQDVSSEDMQKIWSRILAGEVETPGRTSLHTLSILRDMSENDAKKFSELMRFRISDFILGRFAQQVTREGLDTSFLALEHIGLVYSSMVACPTIKLSSNGIYDKEHHEHLLRIEGPPKTEINSMELDMTVLTPSGKELAGFCNHEPNIEYLSCFARYLEAQKCSLKLAPIISKTPDGRMQFFPNELCTL